MKQRHCLQEFIGPLKLVPGLLALESYGPSSLCHMLPYQGSSVPVCLDTTCSDTGVFITWKDSQVLCPYDSTAVLSLGSDTIEVACPKAGELCAVPAPSPVPCPSKSSCQKFS